MAVLLLGGGSRRTRLVAVASLLMFVVFFLFYRDPITSRRPLRRLSYPYGKPSDGADEKPFGHGGDSPGLTGTDAAAATASSRCPRFEDIQQNKPGPLSAGRRKFPLVRPPPECRTFNLASLEKLLVWMKRVIKDPDLYRLFENSYPNTLDTMIKWRGFARRPTRSASPSDPPSQEPGAGVMAQVAGVPEGEGEETDEELTYVITGDIDAMWLRDSASQMYSYLPLLERDPSHDSLAGLWRGLINAQARHITISPYCHSFQPPPESGIPPTYNSAYAQNNPQPPYNPKLVFDCKWELDSLASFLQVSAAYHERTGDWEFFGRHNWVRAVMSAVDAAAAMRKGTYDEEGKVLPSAWTFTGWTNRGSETLTNDGLGNPSRENGMVRTAFRPSDDACIFQFHVPSNMMFARQLEAASRIMARLPGEEARNATGLMRSLARGIREGIDRDAVVVHGEFGEIFAYEVDGYGGVNLMDDANVPSLLAMPLFNYTATDDPHLPPRRRRDYARIYQNTRRFALSEANPYFAKGPVISAVGGPHLGPGRAWPMAAIVAGLTAYEEDSGFVDGSREQEDEVARQLAMVLDSTDGAGVVHESVNSWSETDWTRSWFGWANGLFGELVIRIAERERGVEEGGGEGILGRSWQ